MTSKWIPRKQLAIYQTTIMLILEGNKVQGHFVYNISISVFCIIVIFIQLTCVFFYFLGS